MLTQEKLSELKNQIGCIKDPGLPMLTIQELAILHDVYNWKDILHIELTPTYAECPALDKIKSEIISVIEQHGIIHFEIKVNTEIKWNSKWILAKTKDKFKLHKIAPPQHCCANDLCISKKCTSITCPRCSSKNTIQVKFESKLHCTSPYLCLDCHEEFNYFNHSKEYLN